MSGFYGLYRIKSRGPQYDKRMVIKLMDEFQARRLVDTYADMILRISYQYLKQTCDGEDICQTVFLKYITGNMTFDTVAHEKAWIIRTAINACKDHVKSAWFRRTVALEDTTAIPAPTAPDSWLLDSMKALPEKYRLSLYLYYYEGYSAQKIGELMGVSESAAMQYLSRGRRKLRNIITDEERRTAL